MAFLDAFVLYPAPLRDLLLELAVSDIYHTKWSDADHEEWIRALRQRRPDIARARLERTRRLMDVHVRDALISGFENLVPIIRLPDPDDRHVVAAAIPGDANIILSANLRDFPARALTPHGGLVAQHPDRFLARLCREPLIVSSKPWNASGSGCATPRFHANAISSRCGGRAWTRLQRRSSRLLRDGCDGHDALFADSHPTSPRGFGKVEAVVGLPAALRGIKTGAAARQPTRFSRPSRESAPT